MKKLLLAFFLFIFSGAVLMAQDDELPPPSQHPKPETNDFLPGQPGFQSFGTPKKNKLSDYIIEPDILLSFVPGGYDVGVSPYVGHRIWKNLYGGAGLTYMYTGFKNIGYQDATGLTHYTNASWNTVGGGVFLQYNIWKGFFVRDKFELMHRWMDDVYDASLNFNPQNSTYNISIPKIQKNIPDMLLGVGYNLMQSRNFFVPVMFSYNVLYPATNNLYSMYPRGWVIQLGFIDVF
jgi:hypothetical protein